MSRIATVFGATGEQGGSVVRALLKNGEFKPRAVTRNPSSDSAKALVALGAQVVQGDLGDYESVKKAIAGAEVVFAVTQTNYQREHEDFEQGKNMIDAAKEASVKFFVWSSFESMEVASGGKYRWDIVDDKYRVDGYLRASGLPHSILYTGGFLENWTRPHWLDYAKLDEDGAIAFKARWVPGTQTCLSWIGRDMGLSVSALFVAYAKGQLDVVNGKSYVMACAKLPIEEWFTIMETTLGRKLNITWLDTVDFAAINDMYNSAKEFPWYASRQVPDPGLVALGVQFGTLEDFARTELKASLGL